MLKVAHVLQPPVETQRGLTTSTMPSKLWFIQYIPGEKPLVLNDGRLLQPWLAHFGLSTFTIPCFLCGMQKTPWDAPFTWNCGCNAQPWSAHAGLFRVFPPCTLGCSLCKLLLSICACHSVGDVQQNSEKRLLAGCAGSCLVHFVKRVFSLWRDLRCTALFTFLSVEEGKLIINHKPCAVMGANKHTFADFDVDAWPSKHCDVRDSNNQEFSGLTRKP